jgi:hypothetical protein
VIQTIQKDIPHILLIWWENEWQENFPQAICVHTEIGLLSLGYQTLEPQVMGTLKKTWITSHMWHKIVTCQWQDRESGLMTGFIGHLWLVTTQDYNTINLYTPQITTAVCLHSLFCPHLRCLVMALTAEILLLWSTTNYDWWLTTNLAYWSTLHSTSTQHM